MLKTAARAWPEAPAAVSAQGALTYREYDEKAWTDAQRLRDETLMAGCILGILAPRALEWLPMLMGCFRAGVIAYPINTRLPKEAIADALKECNAQTLFLCHPQTPFLWHPQTCLGVSGQGKPLDATPPNKFGGATRTAFGRGKDAGFWGDIDANAPAVLLQTSGSSGRPKIAVLSYGNLRANAEASNRNILLAPGDVWLLSLPLYHVSGLGVVFRCLAAGATVAVPEEGEDLLSSIERYHVTHVSLVTTQLHRLIEIPSGVRALKKLRAILLGGSGMPPRLIRQALDLGLPIHTSYGLTEMASQVATTTPNDHTEAALRWARPLVPGTVRISTYGEIEVSGPALFLGYREGGAIERPSTPDGWFPTGDLGRLDAEGRLTVLGRKDNLFISGGENIQPEEIERELCAIEGVEEVVVVPVEDAEFGHRPVAFVKPAQEAEPLREALRKRLPGYKIPVKFYAWPQELERPGLKIRRQALIEAIAQGRIL